MTDETWISVDIEASGPTPATGSLLSIGACLVARPEEGIEVRLRPDPALPWDEGAAAIHRLSRDELLRDGLAPRDAMERFEAWTLGVTAPGTRPVLVALNAAFDWMFIADAFWRHLGRNPFGISALDIKGLYLGRHLGAGVRWADTSRLAMLERYPVDLPHTHDALDDAREQAALLRAILAGAGLDAISDAERARGRPEAGQRG